MSKKKSEDFSHKKYKQAVEAVQNWYALYEDMKNRNEELQKELQKCKMYSEALPDSDLENDNRELRMKILENEEKYREEISSLKYENILCEGRIKQLEDAHKDLKERYSEIRQDLRECQRPTKNP